MDYRLGCFLHNRLPGRYRFLVGRLLLYTLHHVFTRMCRRTRFYEYHVSHRSAETHALDRNCKRIVFFPVVYSNAVTTKQEKYTAMLKQSVYLCINLIDDLTHIFRVIGKIQIIDVDNQKFTLLIR
jgi:hypothetical protein